MKSVIVISAVTFLLIFGVIVLLSEQIPPPVQVAPTTIQPALTPEDLAAAERMFQDLEQERGRIQQERESLLALRQQQAIEDKVIQEKSAQLQLLLGELTGKRDLLGEQQAQAAAKLAKMYEAMKPEKAAPILAALDIEITLEIMRRMKDRPAARILSQMDTTLAARISEHLSAKGRVG